MRRLALLMAVAGASLAQPVQTRHLQDGPQLAGFLQGEVLMLGSAFPGKTFQKAVLTKLKAGKIRVRVVTGQANVAALLPIARAGGTLRALPTAVTGGLVITPGALLAPEDGGWQVVVGQGAAAALRGRFEAAWRYATPVEP